MTDIAEGEAVSQQIVENPVEGVEDVILDFDRQGKLLGVELLAHRLLPPGLEPRS